MPLRLDVNKFNEDLPDIVNSNFVAKKPFTPIQHNNNQAYVR